MVHTERLKNSLPSTTAYASCSLQTGPHVLDVPGMPCLPRLHDQALLFAIIGTGIPLQAVFMLQSTCRFPLADGCCDVAEGEGARRDDSRRFDSCAPAPINASKPTALRKGRAFRCERYGSGAKRDWKKHTRSRHRQQCSRKRCCEEGGGCGGARACEGAQSDEGEQSEGPEGGRRDVCRLPVHARLRCTDRSNPFRWARRLEANKFLIPGDLEQR